MGFSDAYEPILPKVLKDSITREKFGKYRDNLDPIFLESPIGGREQLNRITSRIAEELETEISRLYIAPPRSLEAVHLSNYKIRKGSWYTSTEFRHYYLKEAPSAKKTFRFARTRRRYFRS
jgi:hypothetical protein